MIGAPGDDRGLLLGDGLFETILFRAGEPVLWPRHLARLARGCAEVGLPAPDAARLAEAAAAAVAEAGLRQGRAAVRLTWTAGSGGRGLARPEPLVPRLLASAAPSPRTDISARLATASVRRNAGSPASRLKTLSYIDNVLARRQAALAGADEALMLDTEGRLACAAAANLFWIADGGLCTPALECGVLDGVMRGAVLAAAAAMGASAREVGVGLGALDGAQALFLTNSLIGVRPVAWLDGRVFGPHPLVQALQDAVADLC